ncbi:hypothetical protein GCM10025777_26670 [Membranihabitans marinus]
MYLPEDCGLWVTTVPGTKVLSNFCPSTVKEHINPINIKNKRFRIQLYFS